MTGCGCFLNLDTGDAWLPRVSSDARVTILGNTASTTLTQTFVAPKDSKRWQSDKNPKTVEATYMFPLYEGVTITGFTVSIDQRTLKGKVMSREDAKEEYEVAVSQGRAAGLLQHSANSNDVFIIKVGSVSGGQTVKVDISLVQELKHDAQVDGLRYTIPSNVFPRYGRLLLDSAKPVKQQGFNLVVDVCMPEGSSIKSIQSQSHSLSVKIGALSTDHQDSDQSLRKASASLSLKEGDLSTDLVVTVVATKIGEPSALLETHPTIPNHRALMVSLVPKFNLPAEKPEVVFVCDQSGSMSGRRNLDLKEALQIFLKSLPIVIKFNVCAFGSSYSFLWDKSKTYDQESLAEAIKYSQSFHAAMGGTEMYQPVEETFKRRWTDLNLEIFLLTDGDIWDSERLFDLIRDKRIASKESIRLFSLGIGHGASTALVEGVARAGGGFAQFVVDDEKMDKKVVRMLRSAMTPHIKDYSLEIKYDRTSTGYDLEDDGFTLVERFDDAMTLNGGTKTVGTITSQPKKASEPKKEAPVVPLWGKDVKVTPVVSLWDKDVKSDDDTKATVDDLPCIPVPKYIQSPHPLPSLFQYNRTHAYVLLNLDDKTARRKPKSVILRGTAPTAKLELEIPITILDKPGTIIHQLAARKEMVELEEGGGWIADVKDGATGQLLKDKLPSRMSDLTRREATRLGIKFQVGGKWCSFIAVEEVKGVATGVTTKTSDKRSGGEMSQAFMPRMSFSAPPPAPVLLSSSPGGPLSRLSPAKRVGIRKCKASSLERRPTSPTPPTPSTGPEDQVRALIGLQEFDGRWRLTDAFEKLVLSPSVTKTQLAAISGGKWPLDDGSATAVAIAFFETKLADDKETWEMVVEKAVAWLEDNVKDAQGVISRARAILSKA